MPANMSIDVTSAAIGAAAAPFLYVIGKALLRTWRDRVPADEKRRATPLKVLRHSLHLASGHVSLQDAERQSAVYLRSHAATGIDVQ